MGTGAPFHRRGFMLVQRALLLAVFAASIWITNKVSYNKGLQDAKIDRPEQDQAGFVLAVGLKFKSVEDRDQLLESWLKLAAHTRDKEAGAMSYKWLVADNDPTNVLVYERYTRKAAYMHDHKSSEEYFQFKEAQKELDIEIAGQSYIETQYGFM